MRWLVLFACLAMAGCESPMDHGVVRDKHYTPGYTTFMTIPSGKSSIMVPQYHPAQYHLEIDGQRESGETDVGMVRVSKDVYDSMRVGDPWPRQSPSQ